MAIDEASRVPRKARGEREFRADDAVSLSGSKIASNGAKVEGQGRVGHLTRKYNAGLPFSVEEKREKWRTHGLIRADLQRETCAILPT